MCKEKKCIACGGDFFESPLLFLENMPASAQNIPDRVELDNDRGISLALYQCRACGLVQFDTEPVAYYRDVIRAGGGSSTMYELRKKQYEQFISYFGLQGKKILEVGCGQGEFLAILEEFEVNAVGIEHSGILVEKARKKGLRVLQGFIEDENSIVEDAPYDAFVQFNFLEHQPRPAEMLRGIYANLGPAGVGLLTVPSWEYILENDGYYELIRDHIAYYSKDSLRILLESNGFDVLDTSIVNRDTHSFWVRKKTCANVDMWKQTFGNLKSEVEEWIGSFAGKGRGVAAWGASHQGFTLLSTLRMDGKVKYVIDSAEFKQGKYAPASHIPIVSPEHFHQDPVSAILIMAPGYTNEIYQLIRQKYGEDVNVATLRSNRLEKLV